MGRRSSIDRLPAKIREAVDVAIANRATIDEIVEAVQNAGGDVSRSAVGRYSQRYAELVKRQQELATVARAWNRETVDPETPLARMLIQVTESHFAAKAMSTATAFDPENPGGWGEEDLMSRAIKNIASAGKITAEREATIRENERERAAQAGAEAARKAGATPETIDLIKREILGIA